MAVEIRVPPLGESLVDAVVGTWLKREGDAVNRGESLVELETDKVNLDVTAEEDGVLESIARREGEVLEGLQLLPARGLAGGRLAIGTLPVVGLLVAHASLRSLVVVRAGRAERAASAW